MNYLQLFGRAAASLTHIRSLVKFRTGDIRKMDKALIRCVDGEEHMTISFKYQDKRSSLLRPQSEAVEKSLSRIQCTLKKHCEKEMKKRKKLKLDPVTTAASIEQNDLTVDLFLNDSKVPLDEINKSAWADGAVLSIGEMRFQVCRNFPTVIRLCLPTYVLAGCPVFPRISTEFASNGNSESGYKWFRHSVANGKSGADATEDDETNAWIEVGEGKIYTPTSKDVGSRLKLVCLPRNGEKEGEEKEVVTLRDVKSGPESFPFEKRHVFTKEKTSAECFRVMSYNILADLYADSDYSRDFLYPYCPPTSLDIDYREQLLLKEISGYNADILCLQECGKKLFQYCLQPALHDQGLSGLLFCKARETPEGEALFYRRDRFRLLEQCDISLAEAFETNPTNADLVEKVSQSPAMLNQVITRTSVVQVAVLEDLHDPSRRLCVANTHLYFHPRAGHIRLIQTTIILRHLEAIRERYAKEHPETRLAVMLCGDLNSAPNYPGVCELLLKKHIAPNHVQWYCGGNSEFCGGMTLTHSLDLTNACTSQEYTNFVAGFVASLDYVLVDSDHLGVVREIPMPSHDDVISHVALPNDVFPSDHLAIGCEVRWKDL